MSDSIKKVAFYTLGCKVNQYETEAITGLFEKAGYQVVEYEDRADVYVINTCTVTNMSDRKSRQIIRRAKKNNKDSIVVVIGCYAQVAPEEVSNIQGVNLVLGTKERGKIIEYINEIAFNQSQLNYVEDIMLTRDFESLSLDTYKGRTRAFLKIQEGCSQFCAYCIIPYARGPIRSRLPEDVIGEVKKLSESGFKEIVLTGIHVASYGKDIKNTSLIDIIKQIHHIDGIERIRLGSIEPKTVTEEFVDMAGSLDKLCPHYHLSLQSGCDATLKRMNRKYSTEEYRSAVKQLREKLPDVSITTDIIVGFPGETDEEFEETYRFLEEISLAKMHIFKFSPRKGTPAASFKEQIESDIKEMRSRRLIALSNANSERFNKKFIGREMSVLFEEESENVKDGIEGLTPNYLRVICEGEEGLKGKIRNVKLHKSQEDYIVGEISG